jgi:acetyl-CoA synthetase
MATLNTDPENTFVWKPSQENIEGAHITQFMLRHDIDSFDELLSKAAGDVAWFSDAIYKFLNIRFRTPYSNVVDLKKGPAWPKWCVDGRSNIVDTCLEQYLGTSNEGNLALIWEGEDGRTTSLTYLQLSRQVNKACNALQGLGVQKGDAIGLFMPMTPEIVVALLAIAKIGGVILPLFSGYGSGAVAQRLEDANAVVLFTVDGFTRRGKNITIKPVADEAVARVNSVKHVIVLEHIGIEISMQSGRDYWWHELIPDQSDKAEVEETSSEDVLMLIYTSGTTGRPKGTVHTHCGFPVKAAQDMAFGTDIHTQDILYWMTDMGWMMGPWLVFGTLILGSTMFLYDGAPDFPTPDRVWAMIERHKITALGLSPTFIRSLIPHGRELVDAHDTSSLRIFASTGEPWNPDPWKWLFEVVGKGNLPIINYSGGTEIAGGILMGNPITPMKVGAFSGPCPGIAAEIFDENGQSIRNQVGELVIKGPWLGMTRGFWNDPQRYMDTYWSRYTDVWVHGDWASVDEHNLWYIYGRSDDTIKIAGKRVGPAEVESILVSHPSVIEAAAIGVPDPLKGSVLVCFCVTGETSEQLEDELKKLVIAELGKPLAPKEIIFLSDIPKTRNAKVMRRVLRSTFLGEDLGDVSSLVNPESLDSIRTIHSSKE